MNKTVCTLVLAGAATAVLTAGAAPAIAAEAATTGSYTNVRLAKVWGTPKGKDQCISTSGTTLLLRGCGKGSEQRWTLKGSKGLYTIKNKKSGKCAGVASTKSGTVVKQYRCSSSKTQKWALSGSTIISKSSGKALTAESSKSGQKLTITARGNSNSKRIKQEWGTK
ncbi:RICIN domain-containing protein [Streptomyces sp. NPDC006649]|uniref:RICIN domain-containing protein n=1 Tax=Streptomyces sp. NPDC006649 TaxID=3156896 RepID=UPI00339E0463